jgi:hypothetical protein
MDESRAEELLAEYGDYDDDIKLYHVSGTCLLGEFADLLRAFIRDEGDAATMRGFFNEHHMTPSMMHSLMQHWQRRANEAEDLLAKTTDDLMRANRRVEARDRRISRFMLAFEDARRQGLVLPGDLYPPVVLSEEP